MVLLCDGAPREWGASDAALRAAARAQAAHWCVDRPGVSDAWGDEMEYSIVVADGATSRLALDAERWRPTASRVAEYMPEYASWMIEGKPAHPYTSLDEMEEHLAHRRRELASALPPGHAPRTLSCFPWVGCEGFSEPWHPPPAGALTSERCVTPLNRFAALTRNIRARRGAPVDIRVPKQCGGGDGLRLDAMLFGMGCCSLQVTQQAEDVAHACRLHDAFAVLGPLFLALSAATPAMCGTLLATDVRWDVIAQSVDDRTPAERAAGDVPPRFGCVDLYLADEGARFNDAASAAPLDEPTRRALAPQVPEGMARMLAHALARDALVLFDAHAAEPPTGTNALHTYLSTYWKHVRVKPPTPAVDAWLVEFRPMELQPSDFENAAFATIAVLAARALAHFHAVPYVPMEQLRANMTRACARDAATAARFATPEGEGTCTAAELLGAPDRPGTVLGLCAAYLARAALPCPRFDAYAAHLMGLAAGTIPTAAARLRRRRTATTGGAVPRDTPLV